MNQQSAILRTLDAAGVDFLVERTTRGVRVETESRDGHDGISCEGCSVADALAQVAGVLALDLGIELEGVAWLHDEDDDVDAPSLVELEPLVEFCKPIEQVDARGRYTAEYSEAWRATHEDVNIRAAVSE